MPLPDSSLQLYYENPRLKMTSAGRLLVRFFGFVSYAFITILSLLAASSDVTRLRVAGAALLLFLLDRARHIREGDRVLGELPDRGRVNVASYMAPRAAALLERSFERTGIAGRDFYLEIFKEALDCDDVRHALERLDVSVDEIRQKCAELSAAAAPAAAGERRPDAASLRLGQAAALAIDAFGEALALSRRAVEPPDLFAALAASPDEGVGRLFETFSIEQGDLRKALLLEKARRHLFLWTGAVSALGGFRPAGHRLKHRVVNRAWTSRPTPTLDSVSYDFTDLAQAGQIGFMVGHHAEYERVVSALSRPLNPNVLLVGVEGAGKETIVTNLALAVVHDRVPKTLWDRRLVVLDVSELAAAAAQAEFAPLISKIAREIATAGNIILYIPNFHDLLKTESVAYLSAADALLPIVKNNLFPVIADTYPAEYARYIEERSDITGLFEVVHVEEVSDEEAEEILVYEAALLEKQTKVRISYEAIKEAVVVARRYLRAKPLPGSALELLKETVNDAAQKKEPRVAGDDVVRVAETKVNIPIHAARGEEAQTLLNLENEIHKTYIDQEEAVRAVSEALREYRSGLAGTKGPIASFLFVGPTGVGKTELAKILARLEFGAESQMVRFDMTEYQDKQSFFRFIGSPDRAVSGALTEAVLQRPYSLVLLDEFEKAFPDILNLFLQVLDDGRLTDNAGRPVDFSNTIIIATSNAHSVEIVEAARAGRPMSDIAQDFKNRLTDVFRPELLNRFSKIVVFKNLEMADMAAITRLNLAALAELAAKQGIELVFDEPAVKKIAEDGFDPAFGARPLRQVIAEKLRAPLSELILKKQVARGSRLRLTVSNGELSFIPQI